MQNSKKTLSLLITAMLTLSMILAAVPMAKAIISASLSPIQGPVGTKVTVSGTADQQWSTVRVYWDAPLAANLLNETIVTSPTKSYSLKITVPEAVAGAHQVVVREFQDSTVLGTTSATFTVQPSISLSQSNALPGDSVTVTGKGFAGNRKVNIYLHSATTTAVSNEVIGTGDGSETEFSATLAHAPVVPGTVVVTDGVETFIDLGEGSLIGDKGGDGYIDYITGEITVDFDTAPSNGVNIRVDYEYCSKLYTLKQNVDTNSKGSFSTTVTIPNIPVADYGTYTVRAVDNTANIATKAISIDFYILCKPTQGPPGITVNVYGRIHANSDYTVLFGAGTMWVEAFTGRSLTNGSFTGTYRIPTTVTAGSYNFKVQWTVSTVDYTRTSPAFTVGPTPQITLNPTSQAIGLNVTVTGTNFCALANVTVYLDSTVVAQNKTDFSGGFMVKFAVPNVSLGPHKVRAVDQYGAIAEKNLIVLPAPTIIIKTRSNTYVQGDVISIYANSSTLLTGVQLQIRDSTGALFWSALVHIDQPVGYWYVPASSITTPPLPTDAPVGSWNFTAYDSLGVKIASNLFTVTQRVTLEGVITQINQLSSTVTQLQTTVNQLSSTVNQLQTTISGINNQLNALASQVSGIRSSVDSAASTANAAKAAADAAKSAADAAKSAADSATSTAQSAVSAAQSAVSAANSAKSAADSAASSAATAASAAEAAKAAAEGITVPVWIAVVLSLVAAIAAIFAIITIRGKIAG
ncbi:MAG: hypothetical protein QW056_06015 [Candidatus Bathyarchaeia archaeon]